MLGGRLWDFNMAQGGSNCSFRMLQSFGWTFEASDCFSQVFWTLTRLWRRPSAYSKHFKASTGP